MNFNNADLDSMYPDRLFGRIDDCLQDLGATVKDPTWIERAYLKPNPMDYVEIKGKWISDVERRWTAFRKNNSSDSKIKEYDEKLYRCQVYINILAEEILMRSQEELPEEEIDQQLIALSLQGTFNTKNEPIDQSDQAEIFPKDKEEIENLIYDFIQENQLEQCEHLLASLDASQKESLFSSSAKYQTSWASGKERMTPLQYACFCNNLAAAKMFVKHGAKVNDFAKTAGISERASIHFAIDSGHTDIALFLIEHGAVDSLASCESFHAFKIYKLPAEWDVSWTCLTALHMAIIKNMPEVIKAICEKENTRISVKASGSNTVLHLVLQHFQETIDMSVFIEIIQLFKKFKEYAALLTIKNFVGQTPLDIAKEKNVLSIIDI